jgi:hypothetical protein
MKKFIIAAFAFSPLLALAQSANLTNTTGLTKAFGQLVNSALPILIALALLAFFWGLVKFIFSAGDAEKAKEGKSIMIYGVIALVVMVSIWGIINFIATDFGVNGNNTPASITLPTVNGKASGN